MFGISQRISSYVVETKGVCHDSFRDKEVSQCPTKIKRRSDPFGPTNLGSQWKFI